MQICKTDFALNNTDIKINIKNFPYKISEVNENQIKINYAPLKLRANLAHIVLTTMMLLAILTCVHEIISRDLLNDHFSDKGLFQFIVLNLALYTLFVYISILTLFRLFIRQRQVIVLDRLNGFISLPANENVFRKKRKTFTFSQALDNVMGAYSRKLGDYVPREIIVEYEEGYKLFLQLSGKLRNSRLEEAWGFLIWYMDKNRPLPPGEVFDQYRKADHLRRYHEGFSKPLFDSEILTPDQDNLVAIEDFSSEEEYLQYQKAYKHVKLKYENTI